MDNSARRDVVAEIETSPGTVGVEAVSSGLFPFEAFSFDSVSIRVDREMMIESTSVLAKLQELQARLEALHGKWYWNAEPLGGEARLRTPTVVTS